MPSIRLLIALTLASIGVGAHAQGNPNELSKCVLIYWKAAGAMASIGNTEQQGNFMKAGNSYAEAGTTQFGKDRFNAIMQTHMQTVKGFNDNQLLSGLKNCNDNGLKFAGYK